MFQNFEPSSAIGTDFNNPDQHRQPVSASDVYHLLVNVEEYPEALDVAMDIVQESFRLIDERITATEASDREFTPCISDLVSRLRQSQIRLGGSENHPENAQWCRETSHHVLQYAPTALVQGCWLQCVTRVATAHTPYGALLSRLYVREICESRQQPPLHFASQYRDVCREIGLPYQEVTSRSYVQDSEFSSISFSLPNFLLSIGQFPRTFLPELLGVQLAWEVLQLRRFGQSLLQAACRAYSVQESSLVDIEPSDDASTEREVVDAIEALTDGEPGNVCDEIIRRVCIGAETVKLLFSDWYEHTANTKPRGRQDSRKEMVDLLRRMAPHAAGYHGEKQLGSARIDERFSAEVFDPHSFLDELARSRFVTPGNPDKSHLVNGMVSFGGPMLAVFSESDLGVIRRWIEDLPQRNSAGDAGKNSQAVDRPRDDTLRPYCSKAELLRRSKTRYGRCAVRELYHHLVNIEFQSDILPVAERFARDRFARSIARLTKGARPIPSLSYDPVALEQWVHNKHREQVESYRPLTGAPAVSREAFFDGILQLAPLILIDGGWLQGVPSPTLIHTDIGRALFRIFYEELGEGDSSAHHANIYRDLLASMGEAAPPVESVEFANWARLRDSSFDIPVLWLSISCFPRHFMPEILGLNLAVELAGIGGPYMEARDTLRYFGLPSIFVEVHNAADNVANGHAAQSMNAIMMYLDKVAQRDGPHNVDPAWHRIWSGVRSTIPQMGRAAFALHRIRSRLLSDSNHNVPLIFPA